MTCDDRWAHEALDRLFVGELEGKELDKLHTHLGTCQSCAEQYERITRAQARLDRTEVLPNERFAQLEDRLFAKLADNERKAAPEKAPKVRWWMPALSFALAAMVAVFVYVTPNKDEFQARGGKADVTAFGLRAFCVKEGKVVGEAMPGGRLRCAEGSAVQLTYTAPKAAKLKIEVQGKDGAQPIFPAQGATADIAAGVDVPLSFSTPVTNEWLAQPVKVVATFADTEGRPLEESGIEVHQ